MDAATMRADCARCAALCCVAYAFDRIQGFPFDKPNGAPCPHLDVANRCSIYRHRATAGFKACVQYDCLGAGQRVTQEIFAGRSWRDDPALLPAMIDAFVSLCSVHELLVLLDTAAAGLLTDEDRATLKRLREDLTPSGGWSAEKLAAFERSGLEGRIKAFLTTLGHHFRKAASGA